MGNIKDLDAIASKRSSLLLNTHQSTKLNYYKFAILFQYIINKLTNPIKFFIKSINNLLILKLIICTQILTELFLNHKKDQIFKKKIELYNRFMHKRPLKINT